MGLSTLAQELAEVIEWEVYGSAAQAPDEFIDYPELDFEQSGQDPPSCNLFPSDFVEQEKPNPWDYNDMVGGTPDGFPDYSGHFMTGR